MGPVSGTPPLVSTEDWMKPINVIKSNAPPRADVTIDRDVLAGEISELAKWVRKYAERPTGTHRSYAIEHAKRLWRLMGVAKPTAAQVQELCGVLPENVS